MVKSPGDDDDREQSQQFRFNDFFQIFSYQDYKEGQTRKAGFQEN
ncbi:MAG: hypothetical protein UW42_C0058G0013 [Candidatus Collierbacteria bacterium GW2011_GWB1_44_197]|nr:MAG: hypothetical protein UW42_C0058G0013 [Candidatus Collierbacteria bacterium GW2011_GWB1_44_197]